MFGFCCVFYCVADFFRLGLVLCVIRFACLLSVLFDCFY